MRRSEPGVQGRYPPTVLRKHNRCHTEAVLSFHYRKRTVVVPIDDDDDLERRCTVSLSRQRVKKSGKTVRAPVARNDHRGNGVQILGWFICV